MSERDSRVLAKSFVELATALEAMPAGAGVLGVVERVVLATCHVVEGADCASVVLRADDDVFSTVAASDALAGSADELQLTHDEGPSIVATHTTGLGVADSSDLATDPNYPRFGPAAASLGVASVIATGMFPGGETPRFGALNCWSRTPGGLDTADRDHALVLASYAATAIAGVRARSAAELQMAQLREAVDSRDVIGQAKGILMERRGYDSAAAFDVLRRTSQELNIKLRDVAKTLVERRSEI
ncbi:ANTAR domain-containing protein [Actinomycetospora atypica]|uniref:ANTAR domain-containing protein n=2 Tax=Actinomycetospora atypica TaxID=1290095 RepID=A0ABV9YQ59_9PSEU